MYSLVPMGTVRTKELPWPNALRLWIGETASTDLPADDSEILIETNIDDMNPQAYELLAERLFAAGALDVWLTPIQMKKGRPGTLLTILAPPAKREAICDLVFRETTTLGIRFQNVWRETLDRKWVEVQIPGGTVRIKVATRNGEVVNASPEFDDCVRIATATGRPVKLVQAEALRAWVK